MATSKHLDWLVHNDKPLIPPMIQPDNGLEVTYDMATASRAIEATELDTVPAELMEIFFK
jgi:hypothetical protein